MLHDDKTRVFFVVDSREDNEEIFDTLEEAEEHYGLLSLNDNPRIYIGLVNNAYLEPGGSWSYDDLIDTFWVIKVIKRGKDVIIREKSQA